MVEIGDWLSISSSAATVWSGCQKICSSCLLLYNNNSNYSNIILVYNHRHDRLKNQNDDDDDDDDDDERMCDRLLSSVLKLSELASLKREKLRHF
jgi:hypothetical protein